MSDTTLVILVSAGEVVYQEFTEKEPRAHESYHIGDDVFLVDEFGIHIFVSTSHNKDVLDNVARFIGSRRNSNKKVTRQELTGEHFDLGGPVIRRVVVALVQNRVAGTTRGVPL
jgi:hypothetical protein